MPAPKFASEIDPRTGERYLTVFRRGASVKNDPILNKGTCFTERERRDLGLTGLIPPAVSTPDEQLIRAYGNFLQIPDDPSRYTFLASLQDRNETLFYQLVTGHLEEMLPIIYTPTVGKICETYSHIYRRPRGIYVSTADRGHIRDVLAAVDAAHPGLIERFGGHAMAAGLSLSEARYPEFAAAFGCTIGPLDVDAPAAFKAVAAGEKPWGHVRTLHRARYFRSTDRAPQPVVVDDAGRVVWGWLSLDASGILFVGTDLAGDLIRYRQGDPAAAENGELLRRHHGTIAGRFVVGGIDLVTHGPRLLSGLSVESELKFTRSP